MELTTLGELPVGAAFVRHDEWSDGHQLYVKLENHSFDMEDKSACHCGTPRGGRTGPIAANIQVQKIEVGPHLQAIAYCLAASAQDLRITLST